MKIDDSTTKNTRLFDGEFTPKTEHGFKFLVQQKMWFPQIWLHYCHHCYSYSVEGCRPAAVATTVFYWLLVQYVSLCIVICMVCTFCKFACVRMDGKR